MFLQHTVGIYDYRIRPTLLNVVIT